MTYLRQIHRMVGWPGWGALVASVLFSLAYSGIELLFSYFLAHLLYLLQVSGSDPSPPFFLPAFFLTRTGSLPFLLLIGLTRTVARVQSSQSVVLFAEVVRSRLRFAFFRKIYDARSQRMPHSEINTWLGEIFPKTTDFAIAFGNLLTNVVQACFFFAVMLSNSPIKAVAGLAGLLVLGPVVRMTHRHVRKLSHQIIEDFAEVQRSIVRATRNWLLIRLLRTEPLELSRLQHASLSTSQKSLRIEFINSLSAALPELAGVIVVASLLALQYGPDRQPGPAFVAFLYVFMRFIQSIVQVGGQSGVLHANYSRFERSLDLLRSISQDDLTKALAPLGHLKMLGQAQSEPFAARDIEVSEVELVHSAPAIHFENVSFSYPGGSAVIKKLSVEVPAGSAFGIVGPSGVGKSTLLALLMGVESPDEGCIRLRAAGRNFDPINHKLSIGYVGPEPFLIAGSVADNLRYGALWPTPSEALVSSLRRAGFTGNDSELILLLHSQITENGEGLSTGQKQRLCLARALLSNPALLILDEVSANLDAPTESKIADTVASLRGDSTIIIVSHREGMLEPCSRILDLSSGQLMHARTAQRRR